MKEFISTNESILNSSPAEVYNKYLSDGNTSEEEACRAIEALRRVSNNKTLSLFLLRKEDKV